MKWPNIAISRELVDTEGTQILDFTMEGIEKTIAWGNEGIIFIVVDSIQVFNNTRKPGNMIRDWLLDECKDYKGKALQQPKRTDFYPTAATILTMLNRITGQESDQRFVKEFTCFIQQINRGTGIRWSKVISDCLAK